MLGLRTRPKVNICFRCGMLLFKKRGGPRKWIEEKLVRLSGGLRPLDIE